MAIISVVSHPELPASRAISSPANAHVKAAVSLRSRRERDRTGLTLVDGPRELLRALVAGVEVREAFVCDELVRSAEALEAVRRLRTLGVVMFEVPPRVLARVAFGDRLEGVVAVIEARGRTLDELRLPDAPLLMVAEDVEKPGNLGAILRSADGAGADAVLAASPRTDLHNPNAIRASLGTIFTVQLAAAPSSDIVAWLRRHAIRILAARVDGDVLASDADLTGPIAIAVGAEAHGLSPAWSGPDVVAVRLPMLGVADSLNVAAASAVLLYEARRQRGVPNPPRPALGTMA